MLLQQYLRFLLSFLLPPSFSPLKEEGEKSIMLSLPIAEQRKSRTTPLKSLASQSSVSQCVSGSFPFSLSLQSIYSSSVEYTEEVRIQRVLFLI